MGEVAELLGSVLDEITPETWCQGVLHDGDRHCALGWLSFQAINSGSHCNLAAAGILQEVVGGAGTVGGYTVARYNNTHDYEDVVLMFKRGYELALERGV